LRGLPSGALAILSFAFFVIASPPEAGEAIFFSCLFVIASPPKGGRGNLVFFLPLCHCETAERRAWQSCLFPASFHCEPPVREAWQFRLFPASLSLRASRKGGVAISYSKKEELAKPILLTKRLPRLNAFAFRLAMTERVLPHNDD